MCLSLKWSPVFLDVNEIVIYVYTALQNSRNGNLVRRIAAAGIDIGLSFLGGGLFGLCVYLDMDNEAAAIPAIGFSAWVLFLGRDSIIERGTRSPGKKLMKLEIVKTDGQLPSRWNTLGRQLYLPVYGASAFLMPYIFFFAAADLGLMMFTPKTQRLGDFLGRTRVIDELPDRKERVKEKQRVDEEMDIDKTENF